MPDPDSRLDRVAPNVPGGAQPGVEEEDGFSLSRSEQRDVDRKLPPSIQVLHATIRSQGEMELSRDAVSLGWSALAAGMTMGFSFLMPALLAAQIADPSLRFLFTTGGYSVGFLIVILARQQLFTENTITAVLPLMTEPSWKCFGYLLRLWGVVMVGNLIGAAVFAFGLGHMQLMDAETADSARVLSGHVMQNSAWQMFTKGIVAGWLIAIMVWLVPAASHAKVSIIVLMTWLIGLGGFTHIVVGSVEVLYLVFHHGLSWSAYTFHFALPTLAGNIVGGSLIFALLSHIQVHSDS